MVRTLDLRRLGWSRREWLARLGVSGLLAAVLGLWAWMVLGDSGLSIQRARGPLPAGDLLLSVQTTPGTRNNGQAPEAGGGGLWSVTVGSGSARKRAEGLFGYARVSPNGRSIVARDDLGLTWIGPIDGDRRAVPVDQGRPVWSADGRSLFVTDYRMVSKGPPTNSVELEALGHFRIGAEDLKAQRLPIPGGGLILDVSPDGRWILRNTEDRKVCLSSLDGRESRELPEGPWDAGRFSPDGRRLAFFRTRFEGDGPKAALCAVNVDGSGLRVVREKLVEAQTLCWSPDGSAILVKLYKEIAIVRENGEMLALPVSVRKPFDFFHPLMSRDPEPLYIGVAEWLPTESARRK